MFQDLHELFPGRVLSQSRVGLPGIPHELCAEVAKRRMLVNGVRSGAESFGYVLGVPALPIIAGNPCRLVVVAASTSS